MFASLKRLRMLVRAFVSSHSGRYNPHCWIVGKPEIGENVWIGAFTVIDGQGGLKIGNGCDISSGVHIMTHSTVWRCITERMYPVNDKAPVEIGNYCFIGENATILRGVKIGHHSVIGAGAVVKEFTEIPPYSLAAGVPAKVIRQLQAEIDQKTREGSAS